MTVLKIAVHPGRILRDEYLIPTNISPGRLARHLGVPRTRIERLVNEATRMTVDTAMRLANAFGTTPQFWMNLQTNYDVATIDDTDASQIEPLELKHV